MEKKDVILLSGPIVEFFQKARGHNISENLDDLKKSWRGIKVNARRSLKKAVRNSFIAERFPLLEKSVVITGGSRGLGLAIAEQFLAEGANVSLLARDKVELIRAEMSLQHKYPRKDVLPIVCDVTDPVQLKQAFNKVKNRFGKIDILVNNAGAIAVGSFKSMDQEDFDAQMKIHFFAPLNAIREVMHFFRDCGGQIVNVSSIGGMIPVPHMSGYCASKFALGGLSETIASELRCDNIRITTVYPGLMRTGSTIQAVFKGDHDKEFAWFTILGTLPLMTVSARRAARQIVKAVRKEQTQLVISLPAKVGVIAHSLFPNTFNRLLRAFAERLPQVEGHQRFTGASSQGWVNQQKWAKPIMKFSEIAQKDLNQRNKYDGDFNMGIPKTEASMGQKADLKVDQRSVEPQATPKSPRKITKSPSLKPDQLH